MPRKIRLILLVPSIEMNDLSLAPPVHALRAECVTMGSNAPSSCNYAKLKIDAAEGSIETPLVVYTPRDLR